MALIERTFAHAVLTRPKTVVVLQAVTTDGDQAANDYLRFTVRPDQPKPVTWQRVPFRS